MNPTSQFWIGLMLALPLGICANLATTYLTRKTKYRLIRRDIENKERVKEELELQISYQSDKGKLHTYTLRQIISILHDVGFFGILTLAALISIQASPLLRGQELQGTSLFFVYSLTLTFALIGFSRIWEKSIETATQLDNHRNFDEYRIEAERALKKK